MADLGVHEQVHRLVFIVVRARVMGAGHLVERQLAIDRRHVGRHEDVALGHAVVVVDRLQRFVTGVPVQIRQEAPLGEHCDASVGAAHQQPRAKRLVHVADRVQLGPYGSAIHECLVAAQNLRRAVASANRVKCRFGGVHPASHREVNTLEAR